MSTAESPAVEKKSEENEELMEEDEEEEEEEVEDEEEEVEEEEEEEGDHVPATVGRRTGRGLTLKTLLKEGVLEPGDGHMTINYLGNKFKGDLLTDGRIRSQETKKIFGTPSAWAIYCKKIVNPDKKSGCGWASVRYRGKKLDAYKNNWFRQKRLEDEKEEEEMDDEDSGSENEDHVPHEQEIVHFEVLGNRNPNHDPATMVELATFQSIGRMQPFNITMSSSAMAVIDVHAHLTTSEVVGYLAGQWDVNNHNLIVSHAFPVRCRLGDSDKGPSVEQELYAEMARLKLSLVGWYHTHPFTPPLPTLRDVESQLDYEMKMKGYNDATYTPVLGIIVSPYQKSPVLEKGIPHPIGNSIGYWVMPPAENKPLDYGRPMSMQFTVVQDAFIPKEALLHMSEVIKYYADAPDAVELADSFEDKITYWFKLKSSLRGRVPNDHFQPLVDFLTKVIDKKLPENDPVPLLPALPPQSIPQVALPSSLSVSASQLPSSTSISIVEKNSEGYSVKDSESHISSMLRSSLGTDLIPIPSNLSSHASMKDKDNSFSISPSFSHGHSERADDIHISSRSRSNERKTPPKSHSPLFQLPPPPLFSMDSSKSSKDPVSSKNYTTDDKRFSDSRLSVTSKVDRQFAEDKIPPGMSALEYKYLAEYASKLKRHEAEALFGGYMDVNSMLGNKLGSESKGKKSPAPEEIKKDSKDRSNADLSSWFAQAKALQDAFALAPHERDNPFSHPSSSTKDLSMYLSSQWNPTAAAAALHLSRDGGASSGLGSSALFHPSLNFPSTDSKPTYHSDVPLLLKKQQEDYAKEASHNIKDMSKSTSEFKVPKEVRDAHTKDERHKHLKSPHEDLSLKEPKIYDESRESRSDPSNVTKSLAEGEKISTTESSSKEPWLSKDPPPYNFHHDIRKEPMNEPAADDRSYPENLNKDPEKLKEPILPTSADIRISPIAKLTEPISELIDHPMNLADPATSTSPTRPLGPMDMTTFKIKRDMSNPEVRHFIEPSVIKRDSKGRDSEFREPPGGMNDSIINLAQAPKSVDLSFPSTPVRDPVIQSSRESASIRPIINVRDPKNLMENKPLFEDNFEPTESNFPRLQDSQTDNDGELPPPKSDFHSIPSQPSESEEKMDFE